MTPWGLPRAASVGITFWNPRLRIIRFDDMWLVLLDDLAVRRAWTWLEAAQWAEDYGVEIPETPGHA
jgi:hypothetical protein